MFTRHSTHLGQWTIEKRHTLIDVNSHGGCLLAAVMSLVAVCCWLQILFDSDKSGTRARIGVLSLHVVYFRNQVSPTQPDVWNDVYRIR